MRGDNGLLLRPIQAMDSGVPRKYPFLKCAFEFPIQMLSNIDNKYVTNASKIFDQTFYDFRWGSYYVLPPVTGVYAIHVTSFIQAYIALANVCLG